MSTTELANPITLIHNDLFPVANVSHWVATDLTYILGLNTLWIALSMTLKACHRRHTQLAGHPHWHSSNSLLLTGLAQPWRQSTVGKVSCRSNSYEPPNCRPMPALSSKLKMGKLPWLNVRVSFKNNHLCILSASFALSHSMVTADDGRGCEHNEFTYREAKRNTNTITPFRSLWRTSALLWQLLSFESSL